jgi:beta-glucosidase
MVQLNITTLDDTQKLQLKKYTGKATLVLTAFFSALTFSAFTYAQPPRPAPLPYQDLSLSFDARAKDLVSRMTLEEKVPQLINDAPAIPRLGVREYNWWNEGLHGVAALGDATVFPQAIGMAAAWDDQLMHKIGDVISTEFRAKHYSKLHRFGGSDWFAGLTVWSPNINIFRDPRWGRGQETYGEDPYLTSRLGIGFVKGLQGDDPRYLKTVATPKHYAVHSGPEAGRHRDNVNPSAKDLEETYLPAFRATVVESDAQSVMCAYNAIDGIPACAHKKLLQENLREKWGFKGFVVSDCAAVFDIYYKGSHGFTATPEEGIKAAFDSGMDLICGDANEADNIHTAVKKGLVTEAQLDTALVRLFTARMRLGQFDPRTMVFPKITPNDNDTESNRKLNRSVAEKSLVLLKNKDGFLPFKSSIRNIAVIGPNADSVGALEGNYNGSPSHPVTILKGMRARFGDANIQYAHGTGLLDPVQSPIPNNVLCADAKCKKSGLNAEYYSDKSYKDKPLIKRVDANATVSWKNEVASGAVRWTGFVKAPETGTYSMRYLADGGYRIWINDKIVIDAWNVDWRPVIASGTVDMKAGETYRLKIEAFQRGEQGNEQLVWSLPSNPGVESAVATAKNSDAIVFVGGITAQVEGEEMPVPMTGFTGGDRTDINLPRAQRELLKRLYETGKPVVVVLMNGSALAVNEEDSNATALVEAWYPGGQGGEAVASMLAGDFSPAGRLPLTFYKSLEQLPAFNDYSMANRTYKYHKGEVLYPFGYGLSYSKFSYGAVKSPKQWDANGVATVSVDVTNTGAMDADEVVQLYASRKDIAGSPIRALVGFQRVHIPKGKTQKVTFQLDDRRLSTVDEKGQRAVVPGTVNLWVGGGQPGQRVGLEAAAGTEADILIKKGKNLL